MTVAFLVFGPLFAARPMLAALSVAVAVGLGRQLLGEANGTEVPAVAYSVLGTLAIAEMVLVRARDWIATLPSAWRAGGHAVSAGACASLLLLPVSAGDVVPVALAAVAAFICGRQWSWFRGELLDLDPTGILRLKLIMEVMEIGWTVGVAFITAGYPRLALGVVALAALTVAFSAVVSLLWEKSAETSCGSCGKPVHACSLVCRHCRVQRTASRAAWNGRPRKVPALSVAHQQLALTAVGRCARCALPAGSELLSVCRHCGEARLSREEAEQFLAAVDRRLPVTLAVCAAFSAVPLFGIVAGGIYFRLSRNGCLRRYVPWHRKLLARFAVTGVTLALVLLQPVPFIGIVSIPAICLLNYAIDRHAMRAQLRAAATSAPETLAAAA